MRAARPAAGPTLAAAQILGEPTEVIAPSLRFLHNRHIADPFIPCQRRERIPNFRDIAMSIEKSTEIRWSPMKRSSFFLCFRHTR